MRRILVGFIVIALAFMFFMVIESQAHAEWRWKMPPFKLKKIKQHCNTYRCVKAAHTVSRLERQLRVARFNLLREREWTKWTHRYIPDCTWFGESGTGPPYARYRYTLPNSIGSGAYGKFQMMPDTYFSVAKYHDWSPLDQEIAARRIFWQHSTAPWAACG